MEKIVTMLGNNCIYNQMLLKIKEKSTEELRFEFFSGQFHKTIISSMAETETHIYWSTQSKTPRFENDKLFFTSTTLSGATYDKKTKDLKFWFGKKFNELSGEVRNSIIAKFKLDWYVAMGPILREMVNKTVLNRMIKGKITNPRDYVKAYLKSTPFRNIDISPELFYQLYNTNDYVTLPIAYRRALEHSTNPNKTLEDCIKNFLHNDRDLYNQAAMLNKKVNPFWSDKRKAEVHTEWTREIMGIRIKSLEEKNYNYSPAPECERLSFIQSNIELFEEGTCMKHCIYTNYESLINNKKYYGLRYNHDDVRATVGIRPHMYNGSLTFKLEQMYGIGNTPVPTEDKQYVQEWLQREDVQAWFLENQPDNSVVLDYNQTIELDFL